MEYRDYIRDLDKIVTVGDTLVGQDDELSTEYGTMLGRRFHLAANYGDRIVIMDRTDPNYAMLINKGLSLDPANDPGCRMTTVTCEDIHEQLTVMRDNRLVDDVTDLKTRLDQGLEISMDTLIRSIIRVCEVSQVFLEEYLNEIQTLRDVWHNNGANSDLATVRKILCEKHYITLPVSGMCEYCEAEG